MKELYEEYFQVSEEGTVRDKVMYSRAIFALVTVLLFLGMIGFSAYAYFGLYVSTPYAKVEAAQFSLEITIFENGEEKTSKKGTEFSGYLEPNTTYTITLKPAGTANTGFAVLKFAGDTTVYHTQQLGADVSADGGETNQLTFTVASAEGVHMDIRASWGTSAYYSKVKATAEKYVFDGESLIFGDVQTEENSSEETPTETPSETPTETPATEETTLPTETEVNE